MNIFLGILAVILMLLFCAEKDQSKRKCMTWGFIAVVISMTAFNIVKLII